MWSMLVARAPGSSVRRVSQVSGSWELKVPAHVEVGAGHHGLVQGDEEGHQSLQLVNMGGEGAG